MSECPLESLTVKYFSKWLSFTVIKTLQPQQKNWFRKLENSLTKLVKIKNHLKFNETCIKNKLLPTYTNFKLHDDAARNEEFIIDCRLQLIKRQTEEQQRELKSTKARIAEEEDELKQNISHIKFEAIKLFLERRINKTDTEMREKQHRKLCELYGGNVHIKTVKDSIINLSNFEMDENIVDIMSMGMNYHMQTKIDPLHRKAQVEILYEDIKNKENRNIIKITDDSKLKTELERFGSKTMQACKNPLTKEQHKAIRDFTNNKDVIVRKADKSNVFVVMNTQMYQQKIDEILSDSTKFMKIDKDPTEDLKKQINQLIAQIKQDNKEYPLQKLTGHFEPGYIYANPKIHKRLQDPPFRPIISQVGTVTYELSKHINEIIVKYLPKKYQTDSTFEFLSLLKNCNQQGMLASLDVDSLFTNVPVEQTIEIILHHAYNHPTMPPPPMPQDIMKKLLLICTTKTPFKNYNEEIWLQKEGVSMGSALGPTFANFYMCELENKIFDVYPNSKPLFYVRYVDDICLIVDKFHCLKQLSELFERHSVLKFTHEIEINKKIAFLDVLIDRNDSNYNTSVFVKPTNSGECLSYDSLCPDRYKSGLIKCLLFRAFKICSSWLSFHAEVERIKQLLTNNNFPMKYIDKNIELFLNKYVLSQNKETASKNIIPFYFHNQMTANYKQDENQLIKIVKEHVEPCDENFRINLTIFYRARKLGQLFIRNKLYSGKIDIAERHHVVYQYTCPRDGCNSTQSYIGYTTSSVANRFRMHTQNCSSIKKHAKNTHNLNKVTSVELLECVKILKQSPNKRELLFLEALCIKSFKPTMNAQSEFSDRILKIFKH